MLRDVTESSSKRLRLLAADVDATDGQCALIRFDEPIERPQQRRLSGSTLANQCGDASGRHTQGDSDERALIAVRVRYAVR